MANGRGAGGFGRSKVGWEFFGSELKRRRETAGFTQQELGTRVFCSGSYIGQFETGIRKPQLDAAERIDEALKTDGFFARMCEGLINSSPYIDYFSEVAYLEGLADSIRAYAPMFVPGLFQTAAYARAILLATFPFTPDEELESRVATRLARQGIVDHPTEPMLWVVLDESVLRRQVGGAVVMREQLMRVVTLVRNRRIGMQVLPFGAGAPALSGMLKLMTFEDAPPVAYSEGVMSGSLLDDPALVARCERTYDLVGAAALSPEASLSLVQSVAEEYADDC
ncbi:XRE family transcriptional regulator [Streptomyces eurocidicus]|uniref:Transcriptional regulator with XRE-family HTH domain n=1 Tax=Streptomyces eurocidicus TaxID=66423 RepID=A0A2N8NWT0_STREU|nr:helix-turn-helix transcriptional regulator [Streptomyces eurocidicus]MBB5117978.1 transcriptional regulator with XRE-family HTH domain [Streptomyces eurocidicus]MBF6053957.1 helix-turn-helix domain-containing protein [Streptomyces eurocidicus]PNE33221.1 XRE family transcriptional regulator [Streptomyces eurocidicus]